MKRTVLLILSVFGLLASREAQAFYNPSTGRWLSRDPVNEKGSLADRASVNPGAAERRNRRSYDAYILLSNDPINRGDLLGLGPVSSTLKWLLLKPCGKVGRRASYPDSTGVLSPAIDTLSTLGAPHYFVQLPDGTIWDHGGDPEMDRTHWTVITTDILIPRCSDCAKFSGCVKDNWPSPTHFNAITDNCKLAASGAITKCGGLVANSWIFADLFDSNGIYGTIQILSGAF